MSMACFESCLAGLLIVLFETNKGLVSKFGGLATSEFEPAASAANSGPDPEI